MSRLPQQIVAVVVVILLAVSVYVGTYLPYEKGKIYIQALGTASTATSLESFLASYATPLDLPSPIGQEELVRNFVSTMANIIAGNAQKNPAIATQGLLVVDHYAKPILDRGRGLSFVQTVLVVGNAYNAAYGATGNVAYLKRARELYMEGNKLSPNRPQILYGLLLLAQQEGNKAAVKELSEEILKIWPSDTSLRSSLTGTAPSSTATTSKR